MALSPSVSEVIDTSFSLDRRRRQLPLAISQLTDFACIGTSEKLRATKMMWGLEALRCEGRLTELRWFSLEKRRRWGHLSAACQYLKGALRKMGTDSLAGAVVSGQGVTV